MTSRQSTGARGEDLVAAHLEASGYTIVARNVRVGRLELDLIARRDRMLVFCEVRTRTSRTFMDPIESIDRRKIERIRRAAITWLREHHIHADELRFDAASVLLDGPEPSVTYYESAF